MGAPSTNQESRFKQLTRAPSTNQESRFKQLTPPSPRDALCCSLTPLSVYFLRRACHRSKPVVPSRSPAPVWPSGLAGRGRLVVRSPRPITPRKSSRPLPVCFPARDVQQSTPAISTAYSIMSVNDKYRPAVLGGRLYQALARLPTRCPVGCRRGAACTQTLTSGHFWPTAGLLDENLALPCQAGPRLDLPCPASPCRAPPRRHQMVGDCRVRKVAGHPLKRQLITSL
jgi:hypothetical protein